ncbi:MAG: glycine--tRNA ligase, partial [Rhodothermaceae bacterium]|nr:glycine--tRNA ligase [Rhodothermaceae bacterium]
WDWHVRNGIPASKLRWHVHEKPAHYADAAVDIQYEFPIGWQEIEGIHSRTDYDLRRHQEYSGKKMQIFDQASGTRFIPFVVETSAGLDRTVLMLLCEAYRQDTIEGRTRTVMAFAPSVAPIKVGVFPLLRRDGMPERARAITDTLRREWNVFYDEKGSIGKRYRRMDEAGAPLCITIDRETLEGEGVTVRNRDTLEQVRIADDQVPSFVSDAMRGV